MDAVVWLENATLGFDREPLFSNLSIAVAPGQWVSILGPNGSGKTTLLRGLLGVHRLATGRRQVRRNLRIGYVPQRFDRPRETSVTLAEFLAMGAIDQADIQTWRQELSRDLGIDSFLAQPLRVLSPGQIQTALLAFSLWNQPDILFLDEYLEGLDPEIRHRTTGYLEALHNQKKLTVIEVSHDISSVVHTATRVIVVNRRIIFDGAPESQGFHECLHEVYGHHHWIRHAPGAH